MRKLVETLREAWKSVTYQDHSHNKNLHCHGSELEACLEDHTTHEQKMRVSAAKQDSKFYMECPVSQESEKAVSSAACEKTPDSTLSNV